jgi:DNA-binding IclR family transcriptional regulator
MRATGNSNIPAGTQTLMRGMAIVEAVARGAATLKDIGVAIGCTRSTTHRLIQSLAQAGFLSRDRKIGYALGPRLVELGTLARDRSPLLSVALPHLQTLAAKTQQTVHISVVQGQEILYLEKIESRHGTRMRSKVGCRMPLALTAMGKALLLDSPESGWREIYQANLDQLVRAGSAIDSVPRWPDYHARMRGYVAEEITFDREENEPGIRCVAAPVRDADGRITAALSVSGPAPSMSDERMSTLRFEVKEAAVAVSTGLGWSQRKGLGRYHH